MNTSERINVFNQRGFDDELIAAILGADQAAVQAHQQDQGVDIPDGGSSAFAHLTEDPDNGYLYSDIGLSLGTWDAVGGHADYSETHVEFNPTQGIRLGTGNGSRSEFVALLDGSLHWGDGENPLDTTLKRAAAGIVEIGESGGGIRLHSPNGTAYNVTVTDAGAINVAAA
jgi:hypothetical protein